MTWVGGNQTPLLEGKGIGKRFGGVMALSDVSFRVREGVVVGLIGPNGAGKTTLFNIVAGAYPPTTGTVRFQGEDITRLKAFQVCRQGIARTFQVPRPFPDMTCIENVGVAVVGRHPSCGRKDWEAKARQSLDATGMAAFAEMPAGRLNVIQKKRLEIARALATEPRLLMLDEVLGGLNTQEIQEAIHFIRRLRDDRGVTVFWIEHVMGAIMEAADSVIVLDQGRILMQGTPAEVVNDSRVIQAYLGD